MPQPEDLPERCCGQCKHFVPDREYGDCTWKLDDFEISESMPASFVEVLTSSMTPDDGEDCPCFVPRPPAKE